MAIHRFFFVGTLAWYFLLINWQNCLFPGFGIIYHWLSGDQCLALADYSCGGDFWQWLVRRINDRIFYHIAHFFLIILGLRLVYTSL